MKILRANLDNVPEVSKIYHFARESMKEAGNSGQWVNGYPSEEQIVKDIESGDLFKCVENGKIVSCFAFIKGDDPTYQVIHEGSWLNDQPYSVIHRIAVLQHGKGIGLICVDWCLRQDWNIRVDTHRDNLSMQKLLEKVGFQRCGVIKNMWGDERLAFQSTGTGR